MVIDVLGDTKSRTHVALVVVDVLGDTKSCTPILWDFCTPKIRHLLTNVVISESPYNVVQYFLCTKREYYALFIHL